MGCGRKRSTGRLSVVECGEILEPGPVLGQNADPWTDGHGENREDDPAAAGGLPPSHA